MQIERDLRNRQAMLIFFFCQFNAIVFPRQNLPENAERRPVVVVHHDLAHAPSPRTHGRDHLLCKCNRQRSHCLHGKATGEASPWIGFVKLLAQSVRRRRFVKSNEFFEPAGYDIAGLGHQILAERPTRIGEPMTMAGTCGVEEQSRSLDGIAGDDDCPGSLKVLLSFAIEVDDSVHPAIVAQTDARSHCMRPNLCAVGDGVRHMGNQRAGFGSNLAALKAEAAIDAMRSVAMRSRKNRDGSTRNGSDTEVRAAANQDIADAAQWMRAIRMTMRIAPWETRPAQQQEFRAPATRNKASDPNRTWASRRQPRLRSRPESRKDESAVRRQPSEQSLRRLPCRCYSRRAREDAFRR